MRRTHTRTTPRQSTTNCYKLSELHYKSADGAEQTLEAGFTRYSVIFTGERLPDGRKADAVYLILNDPYWEVLNNAPVRPLDYEYLKALAPAAQRFYEIMSYKIFAAIKYRHATAKISYSEYCTYSAQQHYQDYGHVKKQMYKVHRPHLQSGYLKKITCDTAVNKDGTQDWIFHYTPGPKALAEFKAFNSKHAPGGDTLAQESVLPIETPEASAPEQARQLVRYFHRCFHQNDIVIPTTKELEFAAALIAEHGMKTSRFVVEYSVEEAATTKYSPAMLVGIRQYVDAAIKKWDAREAQQQKEKLKAREAQLKEQYERYRDHETDFSVS